MPAIISLPFTWRTTAAAATFTCMSLAIVARGLVYTAPTGFGAPNYPQPESWTQIQLAYGQLYAQYKIIVRQDVSSQSTAPLGVEPWPSNNDVDSDQFAVLLAAVTAALAAAQSLLTQIEAIEATPQNYTTLADINSRAANAVNLLNSVLHNMNQV